VLKRRTPATEIGIGITEHQRFITIQPPLKDHEITQFTTSGLIRSGEVIPSMSVSGPMSVVEVPTTGEDAKTFMRQVALGVYGVRGVDPVLDSDPVYMGTESSYTIPFFDNTPKNLV
jgi:hypothetical protein